MTEWNVETLSSRFLREANSAEGYLRELRFKIETNKSYERVYDEHLARFYVFNYLHGRTFLYSREALLKELKDFSRDTQETPSDAYDPACFKKHRKLCISKLIEEFSHDAT